MQAVVAGGEKTNAQEAGQKLSGNRTRWRDDLGAVHWHGSGAHEDSPARTAAATAAAAGKERSFRPGQGPGADRGSQRWER